MLKCVINSKIDLVYLMSSAAVLPVSDPGKDDNDKIFRGSAMTKRAAYAAISYMACAGFTFLLLGFD